jgi:hypothetical protein
MFFDIFAGSRLRRRRGKFYGISLLYRNDRQPLLEDLPGDARAATASSAYKHDR